MGQINLEDFCLNEFPLVQTYIIHLNGILRLTHLNPKGPSVMQMPESHGSREGAHVEARDSF